MDFNAKLIWDYIENYTYSTFEEFTLLNTSIEGSLVKCSYQAYDYGQDDNDVKEIEIELLDLLGFVYRRIPKITVN